MFNFSVLITNPVLRRQNSKIRFYPFLFFFFTFLLYHFRMQLVSWKQLFRCPNFVDSYFSFISLFWLCMSWEAPFLLCATLVWRRTRVLLFSSPLAMCVLSSSATGEFTFTTRTPLLGYSPVFLQVNIRIWNNLLLFHTTTKTPSLLLQTKWAWYWNQREGIKQTR